MAKYLIKVSYSAQGTKGVAADGGTRRRDEAAHVAEQLGGSLESFYYAFGATDAYIVIDFPDHAAAVAASLAANGSGGISSEVVVLLTPEEVDEAAKRSVDFSPPGA